jgi:hypothetical protein
VAYRIDVTGDALDSGAGGSLDDISARSAADTFTARALIHDKSALIRPAATDGAFHLSHHYSTQPYFGAPFAHTEASLAAEPHLLPAEPVHAASTLAGTPGNFGMSDEVAFVAGVYADGTLPLYAFSAWNNDTPATYTGGFTDTAKWGAPTAHTAGGTVDYYFTPASNWNATEQQFLSAGLALWSDVANISFVQTTNAGQAQIIFTRGSDGGAATDPQWTNASGAGVTGGSVLLSMARATVSIDTSVAGFGPIDGSFTTDGGYPIMTFLHEEGHAIGLGHAGPYNGDVNEATQQFSPYDTRLWSIMSYIEPRTTTAQYFSQYPVTGTSWGIVNGFHADPTGLMPLDILAAQQLYGAPASTPLSGGQIFGFNSNIAGPSGMFFDFTQNTHPILTIWDAGTGNTLDLSGYGTSSTVNLNPGTFSSFDGMANNMAVAFNTSLDTLILGGGSDVATANNDGDMLKGGLGADTLTGGTGNDTLNGGGGNDTLNGGAGSDTAVFTGARANYQFHNLGGGVLQVVDARAGSPDGTDTVQNIETASFSDGTVAVGTLSGPSAPVIGGTLTTAPVASMIRVSTTSTGIQGTGESADETPQFSADGTKVVFGSSSANFVAGAPSSEEVYVKNLVTGAVTMVSTSASGTIANDISFQGSFSADGTKVVFASSATNLVAGDTNNTYDIFVKDLGTGAVTLVSTTSAGAQLAGGSISPQISADDKEVLFTNGFQIEVKNLSTGALTIASSSAAGVNGDGFSDGAKFSADGTKVGFESSSSNLVTDQGRVQGENLYVKDLTTGAITLISTDASGNLWSGIMQFDGFSPDGTKALIEAYRTGVVPNVFASDVYIKDLVTGAVTVVSSNATGTIGDLNSINAHFSADGSKVVFASNSDNLVAGVTSDVYNLYEKDLNSGAVTLVSQTAIGGHADDDSSFASLSADGSKIVLISDADNLVVADNNEASDTFVASLGYVAKAAPVTIAGGLTLADADSASLAGATVTISGGFQSGDTLSAATAGTGITASYNATTHVLTLSGSDTVAHYQSVLRSVAFSNPTNNDPAASATRTFTWVANDGTAPSNAPTTTINVFDTATGTHTGDVVIDGIAGRGQVLTADTSTLADPNGLGTLHYVWLRDLGGAFTQVGTDQATYTPDANDVGHFLDVQVFYVDGHGNAEMLTAATARTIADVDHPPQGSVTITGSLVDGQVLNADASQLFDQDGISELHFQWQHSTANGFVNVGIDSGQYTLTDADVGTTMRVIVSYLDGAGYTDSVTTTASTTVANVNHAPTGAVTISGTVTEDQTLTAVTTAIADADGLGTFQYHWQRDSGSGFVEVGNQATYTLGDADVGTHIRVVVNYTDGRGNAESLTSGQTAAVANVNDSPTGAVTISGTVTEDRVLTADTGTIADKDGLGTFGYQWQRDTGSGFANIGAATAATYTLGDADVGAHIRVIVKYTDGHGTAESLTSAATASVANVNDAPTGAVVITGTTTEDHILTATTNTIADADGLGAFSYQWQRYNGSTFVNISGATAVTYTLGDADVSTFVRAIVSYTDQHGTAESLTSDPTGAIANVNDAPTGAPTITGTLAPGRVLTAVTTSVADNDGLGPFHYQWQRDTGSGFVNVGVDQSSYTITSADGGGHFRVVVSYVDGHGTSESLTSVQTAAVPVDHAPTGAVTISGDAVKNLVLTANTSTIADADGLGTFHYQWQALDSTGAAANVGFDQATYTPDNSVVGKTIRVVVLYTDAAGFHEEVISARTVAVANADDPPVLRAVDGGGHNFIEQGAPVLVDSVQTLTDDDSTMMTGATVTITDGFHAGDTLRFTDEFGITGSYDASTHVLTLSGTADIASYQAALRSVAFKSTSDDPTNANRTISFTVSDGTFSSQPNTTTIFVTPVNDPPVGVDVSTTFLQGASHVFDPIDFHFADVDGNAFKGIIITTLPTAGTITFNGVAVTAGQFVSVDDMSAMKLVYTPPTSGSGDNFAHFTFQIEDTGGTANGGVDTDPTPNTFTFDIVPPAQAPVIGSTGNTVAYVEQASAVLVDSAITVTDSDSSVLNGGATVTIAGGFVAGDVLSFTNQGGLTGSYNAANHTLTIIGSASAAVYQAALRSVTFSSTSDDPTAGGSSATRTIAYSVADGNSTANAPVTSTVTVTAINDAPVLAGGGNTLGYIEQATPITINSALTLHDVDNGSMTGATVTIASGFNVGDVLSFTNQLGITGSYNAATHALTLSGLSTVANYELALRSITFAATSDDPTLSGPTRTISFTVNDGTAASAPVTTTINVTAVNDPPSGTDKVVTSLSGGIHPIDAVDLGFSDGDGNAMKGVVITTLPNVGTITDNGVLVTAGQFISLADLNAHAVFYNAPDGGVGTNFAHFTFQVVDTGGTANGGIDTDPTPNTFSFNFLPRPVPPVIGGVGNSVAYVEHAPGVLVDSAITVTDSDSLVLNGGATVTIAGGFVAGDVLGFTSQNGLTGSYNSANHTLTIIGTASAAVYQAALRSVTFSSTSDDPTAGGSSASRSIAYSVSDGNTTPNAPVTSTVTVTAVNSAPILAGAGNTVGYTEQAPAFAIDTGLTVGDADTATLVGATVKIAAGFTTGDVLGFVNQAGITGSYNAATHILTLSGTASLAAYQTALRSVTFSNPGDNPDNFGASTTRTISWQVDDGQSANHASAAVTSTIAITAVDDPAIAHNDAITVTAAYATGPGLSLFADNGSGSDSDPDTALQITAVNGVTANVGSQITLASGALLTVNADGTFTFDPNHVYDSLAAAGSGATNVSATETFTYTLAGGAIATATITVAGADDNDTLLGTHGNDTFDGGAGIDTLMLTGNQVDYTIVWNAATLAYTVTDNRGGSPDGTDTVRGVENFHFADGTVSYATFVSVASNAQGAHTTTYDAANDYSWANIAVDTDAQGSIKTQTVTTDTGTTWVNTFQTLSPIPGTWDTQSFANGHQVTDFTSYGDGTRTLILNDTANAYAWANATISFDANWNITGVTGTNDDGSHTVTMQDIAAAYDTALWFKTPYDPYQGAPVAITLTGGGNPDTLYGHAGNDTLNGAGGNDYLNGGTGNDMLTGGAGDDRFYFQTGDGQDTITDFTPGNASGDVIELHGYGVTSFAALQPFMSQSGGDTVIAFDDQNHIVLHNVTMAQLNSGDFLFS